jgi:hypothetical protein
VTITAHAELKAWSGELAGQVIDQTVHWADEFLLRPPRVPTVAPSPVSEHIVPPESNPGVAVWRLTRCKRFGDPLLSFVKKLLPKVAEGLTAMPDHPATDFRTVYYSSPCEDWWSMHGVVNHFRIKLPRHYDRTSSVHVLRQVVWNHGLFSALITCILRQLVIEVRLRRDTGLQDPVLNPGEMLVFVGFALNRLKVPFQFLINQTLSWKALLDRFELTGSGLTPDMVSVRLANDSTGPTFLYGHVVRHPRYRDTSKSHWEMSDLQTGGDQTKDQIQYIMLTRAVKDCTLWVHTEPLGWPGERRMFTDDLVDREGHLQQHEKLIEVTGEFKNILLDLENGQPAGFQFEEDDEHVLGGDWWNTNVTYIREHVVKYYMLDADASRKLLAVFVENLI